MNNTSQNGIIYQSFSYKMLGEILSNKHTPAWIRLWLYFSMLDSKGKPIYMLNKYISKKLGIPESTIKYSITKLKNNDLIVIDNAKSWRRQIRLTHKAIIKDTDVTELKLQNDNVYQEAKGRKQILDYVFLTEEEQKTLIEIIGEDASKYYLKELNVFLSNSNKRYDSHFKLLTIWYNKNEEQKKLKKKKFDIPEDSWYLEYERNFTNTKPEEMFDYNWLDEENEEEDFY